MEYVIRRRKKNGIMKNALMPKLEINSNRGLIIEEEIEERIELLSPSSVAFHKPDFNVHVLAILGFKTSVSVDLIKAKFPSTLLKHPRFSSVVVITHFFLTIHPVLRSSLHLIFYALFKYIISITFFVLKYLLHYSHNIIHRSAL